MRRINGVAVAVAFGFAAMTAGCAAESADGEEATTDRAEVKAAACDSAKNPAAKDPRNRSRRATELIRFSCDKQNQSAYGLAVNGPPSSSSEDGHSVLASALPAPYSQSTELVTRANKLNKSVGEVYFEDDSLRGMVLAPGTTARINFVPTMQAGNLGGKLLVRQRVVNATTGQPLKDSKWRTVEGEDKQLTAGEAISTEFDVGRDAIEIKIGVRLTHGQLTHATEKEVAGVLSGIAWASTD